ncbi:MAG TPA: hypothetical protein VN285_08895 [Candidatus Deferrimicrobium sp.]|nr:hypothetical protein [Candidatus Deferrimicrobium sp.]
MKNVFESRPPRLVTALAYFACGILAVPGLIGGFSVVSQPLVTGDPGCARQSSYVIAQGDSAEGNDVTADDSRPIRIQAAFLAVATGLKPANSDGRFRQPDDAHGVSAVPLAGLDDMAELLTSTSLISADLGRRERLVGAKPSGTS